MERRNQPDHLWFKLFTGLLWLALPAAVLHVVTGYPFVFIFVMLFLGSLLCCGLGLWWMTLWALRRDSRVGQFTVGSLLFATLFLAMFLGFVRWVVGAGAAAQGFHGSQDNGPVFLAVALICLVWCAISVSIVASMTEAVLWGAVWLLKRPAVRRWRRSLRNRADQSQPSDDS